MLALVIKVALTATFIVALSELGKRVPGVAGLIVALPLATAMTMALMHIDGEGTTKIATFAWSTLVYTPPSLVFLLVMVFGLWVKLGFWPSLAASVMVTGAAFGAYVYALGKMGISLPG